MIQKGFGKTIPSSKETYLDIGLYASLLGVQEYLANLQE